MSWMRRPRGSPGPPAAPAPSASAPAPPLHHQPQLPSNQPQPWQQNVPNNVSLPQSGYSYGNVNPALPMQPQPQQQQPQPPPPPHQQYWQQPPQNANQQNAYNHNYNQQSVPHSQSQMAFQNDYFQYNNQQQYPNPNSNAYAQQQNFNAYNQAVIPNQQYNVSQVHQQQNYSAPSTNFQGPIPGDQEANETDPWNWGWEDNSATDNKNPQKMPTNSVNANVISDSFTNSTQSWNFSVADPHNHQKVTDNQISQSRASSHNDDSNTRNNLSKEHKDVSDASENVHFNDKPIRQNQDHGMPESASLVNQAISKTHIGNIQHGWSTESQPSQESSDGLLSHAESTTGSEDPSRSFDKNSPAVNINDNTNFNYVQVSESISDISFSQRLSESIPAIVENIYSPGDNANRELADGVRKMNIGGNSENIPSRNIRNIQEVDIDSSNIITEESPIHNLPPAPSGRDSSSPNVSKPPMTLPPPSNVGNLPQHANTNPFKRTGQISHRIGNKSVHLQPANNMPPLPVNQQPIQDIPFQQDIVPANARQPSPLTHGDDSNSSANRIMHHANLETTPDNSERPDNPSPVLYPSQYPHPVHQNPVENCEIAPNNDRNEYLQTGHLSNVGFDDNTNFMDNIVQDRRSNHSSGADNYPPPGLRRMVLGQPELQFNPNSSFPMDEPPPGLSRMVPGHPAGTVNMYNQSNDDYLDRQIDGQTTESDSLTNSACMTRNSAVYRQVDGQPTDDENTYNQNISSRSSMDRRPVGFDRMVPGEASSGSNFSMSTFQNQSFNGANEERVVTGFEQVNPSETREQNVDGSDYSEVDANQIRNVVGGTETGVDARSSDMSSSMLQSINPDSELQRDLNMEGENLQDLSAIPSVDFSMVRDQNMDGADTREEPILRKIDPDSESDRLINPKPMSSQQLSNDIDRKFRDDTTGDESERDRMYKMNSLRKEKEGSRHRSSKERDRYNDRRDERRGDKDKRGGDYRGERDGARNDDRRFRKTRDHRYDTEDTDYYSDRDRRRYREGSYSSSKPPRPDDRRREDDTRKSYERSSRDEREKRRRDDMDRDRRYDSYESERDGNAGRRRDREKERDYEEDRHRRYGTVERDRNYSRRDRTGGRDDRKRNDGRYRPARPDSRDPDPTEDEPLFDDNSGREHRRDRRVDEREKDFDRDRRSNRHRRDRDRNDQYYERYGYPMDAYSQQIYQQHQTYQYYEKLRLTNPQAYLEIYNKYMSNANQSVSQNDVSRAMSGYGEGYTSLPSYDPNTSLRFGDDRGSVHSGRSSTNGEAIKDRMVMDGSGGYYYPYRRIDNPTAIYMKQDTPTRTRGDFGSVRTDYSGSRDFNTDASLNLYLDDSTIKSERLTPVKFATTHIKGVLSSPNLVVINPSYPSDGQPALVEILNINKVLANDPIRCELLAYPGPLIKGTTHKKTVIEFCELKIKAAIEKHHSHDKGLYTNHQSAQIDKGTSHVNDLGSVVLMWELLILLLRQNGMVVGTDIAELLVKNKNQYIWRGTTHVTGKGQSRRDSASSATSRSADLPLDEAHQPVQENQGIPDADHDSSNETSLHSIPGHNRKERKSSKDNSAISKAGRKTSSNLENSQHIQNEEKYVTDKFREYLLFGSGKDALEWAMSHGLWGHALFLASKLDRRTYANVMARFANGLLPNDPLQTLYQLMSGRQPAAVTCVSDEKWGDWRPHLAMILSNTSQRPDLDKKSIMTLGDTLQARGDLFASQFCYLMARVEFGKRPIKLKPGTSSSRLVLLGSSPSNENFSSFASNEAIMMTEIYEYACSLNDDSFVLLDFQFYKYLLATRLMEYGFYDRALFYMEKIALIISQHSDKYNSSFVEQVLKIAERLKHYDPEEHVGDIVNDDDDQNETNPFARQTMQRSELEQSWITNLRQIAHNLNTSVPTHATTTPQLTHQTSDHYDQTQIQSQYQNQVDQSWNQQYQNYNSQLQQQQLYNLQQQQQQIQTEQQVNQQQYPPEQQYADQNNPEKPPENENTDQPPMYDPNYSQNNTSMYYTPGNVPQFSEQDTSGINDQQNNSLDYGGPYHNENNSGYWNSEGQNQQYQYEPEPTKEIPLAETTDNDVGDIAEQPRPQISMPNAGKPVQNYYDNHQDNVDNASPKPQTPTAQEKLKEKAKKDDLSSINKNQANSGWFGGIFNKLSLKPKNQMILPDDKNPTIVWDPEKKKWTNLDADEDEQETQLAPPPKIPDILKQSANFNNLSQVSPASQPGFPSSDAGNAAMPPMANSGNIFKLQKGRHIKKSYVDVFNPSGAPMRPLPPASEVLGVTQPTAAPQTYFVPQGATNDQSSQMAPSFYNPTDFAS